MSTSTNPNTEASTTPPAAPPAETSTSAVAPAPESLVDLGASAGGTASVGDEFASEFANLTADNSRNKAPAPAPEAAAPAPAPEAAAPAPAPEAAAPAPEAAAPAPAPAPAPAAAAPVPEAAAPAPDAAALQRQIDALQAQLTRASAPAAAEPAPAPAPVYTAAEQEKLTAYQKEWPDVAAGEALLRRAEYQQLVGYIFEQISPRLDALAQASQVLHTRTQYEDIKRQVDDYDTVRDLTIAWVDTQPTYLRGAYQQVMERGSAADVADMIARFKRETGYVSTATAAPAPALGVSTAAPAPAPAPAAPAVSAAAIAAAASLAPIVSGRSTPKAGADKNDYDGAFKEFSQTT